jgi:hypothetical protein
MERDKGMGYWYAGDRGWIRRDPESESEVTGTEQAEMCVNLLPDLPRGAGVKYWGSEFAPECTCDLQWGEYTAFRVVFQTQFSRCFVPETKPAEQPLRVPLNVPS